MTGLTDVADVLAAHAVDMSDETYVDGVWTYCYCCDCGDLVPATDYNDHVAAAILAVVAEREAAAVAAALAPIEALADEWEREFKAYHIDHPVHTRLRAALAGGGDRGPGVNIANPAPGWTERAERALDEMGDFTAGGGDQ